jgi:hypothetical protein
MPDATSSAPCSIPGARIACGSLIPAVDYAWTRRNDVERITTSVYSRLMPDNRANCFPQADDAFAFALSIEGRQGDR